MPLLYHNRRAARAGGRRDDGAQLSVSAGVEVRPRRSALLERDGYGRTRRRMRRPARPPCGEEAMVLPGLEVDSPLRTDVVKFSEKFGRRIRQDPPAQLGVPTQDLAILALRRGAREDAVALGRYMVEEFKIVHDTVLNSWLHQIL